MSQILGVFKAGVAFFLFSGIIWAQVPEISEGVPERAFLGEEFCFDTRFTNTGDPGFGPYFRLILPPQLTGVSATVFGASIGGGLQPLGTFPDAPDAPELIDPRIGEAVNGAPGFSYYNVALPVGSVVEGGPALDATICATISQDAIVGDPLPIAMTPIYQFGDTATGVNGPILGTPVVQNVTPTVLRFSKSNDAPEGERATGPSWPYTYTLDVDIANTATINPITISDTPPPGFQYLDGTASVTGGVGCSITQVPSAVSPGGSFEVQCAGDTIGAVGSGDVVVRYSGYLVNVLNQNVCTTESIVNSATVAATYIDQEDTEIALADAFGDSTVTAEHVTLQKSASPGSVVPGGIVVYTLSIQVSDFGAVNSLVITDVIADGIDFNDESMSFSVNGGDPIAVTPTVNISNDTTVVLDLFDGTGLTDIAAGSAIVVNYSGTVRETYRETTARVVASDVLPNSVSMLYSLTAGANGCTEGSAASTLVRPVNSSKTIVDPQDFYQPGEVVIYRLRLDIPSGDTRGIRFVDYLPLPALKADEVDLVFNTDPNNCPTSAGLCRGPNDTAELIPVITANPTLNAIVIEWPDVEADEAQVIEVDLYTTVTDDPFADGLFLTNIVLVETNNTREQTATNLAPVPVNVSAPRLEIDKAVSVTSGDGTVIGGNLTGADAGDSVTYEITLTNTGGAPAFNVTVTDPPPAGLESCTAASVQVGGFSWAFSGNLADGLEIDGQVSAGESAVITYTCTLAQSVTPRQGIENEAVATWASQSGSAAFPAIRDDANVTIASPGIAKTSTAVSPGPVNPDAVPGDVVTYRLTVTVPEGTIPGLVITDQLPAGFEYVANSVAITTTGFNGTITNSPPTVGGSAQAPEFQFGTVTADGTAGTANNSFVVTYQARVLNVPANAAPVNPQGKTNTAALNFTDNPGAPVTTSSTLQFLEPNLTIAKSFSPASDLVADQQVTITFALRNTGTAPAFDLSIEDILNDGLFNDLLDLDSVAEGVTPAEFTFGYNEVTGTLTYTASDPATSLAPGDDPLVFTFNANVLADVVTGSVYSNTVTARGYSQSQPQPDGDDVDQRRLTEATDTATVNVASATVTKALAETSEAFTTGSDVAIGETFTYTIGFELPPGVTRAVRLADVITDGLNGVALVEATLARSSEDLTAVGNPGGINSAATNNAVAVDLTADSNAFVVNLGDVTNSTAQFQSYTLRVTLRVANAAANIQNRQLRDRGRILFADAAGTERNVQSPLRTVTVRLPVVGLQKTVSPSSPAAGDTVTYTLTVTNTGNATGFEWTFEDVLPSELINPGAPSWDVGGTGAVVNAAFADNILSGTIDRLAPGGSIVVSYQATIDPNTGFGTSVTNSAQAATTSLPPESPNVDHRRTGAGGVNNLFGSDTAPLTTARPTLVKSVIDPQSRYAIGDVIHYRLEEGVPVGTTNNLVVLDDLPGGVIFLNEAPYQPVLALSTGVTYTGSGISFDVGENRLVVDLATLTATQAGTVTVDYFVRVDNALANQDGVTLTNLARARFQDPQNPGGDPIELGPRSVSVTLGEPRLVLGKSIPSGGVGLQAGDPVDWRIVIENTGTSTAWQTELRDVLPTGSGALDLDDITVAVLAAAVLNADGDPVSVDDVQIQTTFDPDDTLLLEGLSLSPGARLQIDFRTRLEDDVVFGEILVNEAIATFASQPTGSSADSVVRDSADALDDPAGLNDYRATASTALTIASDLAIGKTVDRNQATIGEELTYTIRLSLITGVTENVFVSDELPDGLAYVSHNISVGHMGIEFGNPDYNERLGAGQLVQFDLGNVSNPPSNGANDNFVEIDITARVTNVVGNENGVVFSNGEGGTVWVEYGSADEPPERLTFDAEPSNPDTISGIPVTVVEPALDVSKIVAPSEQALGNEVVFTVDLAHASGSSATAFDLVIRDLLPDGLSFVAGSASLPEADVSVDGQELEFRFSTLELGQARSFSYRALVDPAGPVGAELANALGLTWTSLPGSSGAEDSGRTGDDGPEGELNNYAQNSEARVTVTADAFLYAVKTVAIAVDGGVAGQIDPGDTLEYTIVLTNQGPDVTGVVFTDPIPFNTAYVVGSLSSTAGTVDDSGDPLVVDIGDLAGGATVTITFRVIVDTPLPPGVIISNQGSVDSNQTVPTPTDADGIPENGFQPTEVTVGGAPGGQPGSSLRFTKDYALTGDIVEPFGTINDGDQVTYTLVISNTGQEPLTNVVFSDSVPAGPTPPGMTVTGITTTQGTAPAPTNEIVIDDIGDIAPGASVLIRITGTLNGTGAVINQATVSTDQLENTLSDGDGNPDSGAQPTVFPVLGGGVAGEPGLTLGKTIELIDDANSDGQVNPGETVRFTLLVRNTGAATARDVRLSDDLSDVNGTLIPGTVLTSQGVVISEAPEIRVNLGDLSPGASATVRFLVVAGAPGELRNEAVVSDAEGNSAEDSASVPVVVFQPFDPPSGRKLVNDEGVPELEWTMVWLNPNDTYVMPLRVVDPIPANSSFVQGSLQCVANGVSQTDLCTFDPATNEVVFEGRIGPDPGATDETDSQNAVIIVFRVEIGNLARAVSNQASAQWDEDGNGFLDPGQNPVVTNVALWRPARPDAHSIPSLSIPMMVVLSLLLFLLGSWVASRSGRV